MASMRRLFVVGLLVGSPVLSNRACETDANGAINCDIDPSIHPEHAFTCDGFQKTAKCDPNGKKESSASCSETIEAGTSGHCLCRSKATNKQILVRKENCNHVKYTCEDTCRRAQEFSCLRFVKTQACTEIQNSTVVEGTTHAEKYLSCDHEIDVNQAGYCECGGGRLSMPGSCHNPKFSVKTTCRRVCERGPNPYEELGTHKWATEATLKQNFRKLSLKYHPDKNPENKEKFEGIRNAMDLLSDKKTKVLYDMGAYELVKRFHANELKEKTPEEYTIDLSLSAMYNGQMLDLDMPKRTRICPGCTKKSKAEFCTKVCTTPCPPEIQLKYVMQGNMRFQMREEVPSKLKCRKETGKTYVPIDKGTLPNEVITLAAEGDQDKDHVPADIIVKINEKPDKVWKRRGHNLHREVEISLKESLLGFKRHFQHLDGRTITVAYEGVTQPMAQFVVEKEGFPNKRTGSKGNLVVTIKIKFPSGQLHPELQESVRKYLK